MQNLLMKMENGGFEISMRENGTRRIKGSRRKIKQKNLLYNPRREMYTVNDTLGDYEIHMKYDKRNKKETIRGKKLSLTYFTALYGITNTANLQPDDMYTFYEHLKTRKKETKNKDGKYDFLDEQYIYKVMVHLHTYITRLQDRGYLKKLTPNDVPINKPPRKVPIFLEEEELAKIMTYLEDNIKAATVK